MSKLKDIRTVQGLTQVELARAAGVTQQTVSNLESGTRDINKSPASIVARLAYALGVDITSILEDGRDDGLN